MRLDPSLDEQVVETERALFPPRTMADAEALAAAGDSVVQFLQYRRRSGVRQIAACIVP